MKNKFKYLIALVMLLTVLAATSVFASAEEISDAPDIDTDETNFFSAVYEEVSAYTSEILCAMTFIGSLVLAFTYKKGLLPFVQTSLVTIGNAVNKIKENASESAQKGSELGESIEHKLLGATELLDTLAARIESLESDFKASLENEKNATLEKRQLMLVVDAQIDMLYDIFMSSALPQYQKDAVGERVAKMKEAIAENANEK